MKRKKFLPLILAFILVLSSCTSIPSKVESLATAPILRADQKEILEALKKNSGEDISLKYPVKGANTSPFLTSDVDLDGEDEVIAFYQASSEAQVQIALLDRESGKWHTVYSVLGDGNAILKADFIKFSGSREGEIVVGFSDSLGNGKLSIYKTANGEKISTIPFMEYDILSYGSGINDRLIVVNAVESAATKTLRQKISYYQYLSDNAQEYTFYEEESLIKDYQQIECIVRPDFSVFVYIDYTLGNETFTEVLKIQGDVIHPVLEKQYKRTVRIYCRDINGDSIPDIPREIPYKTTEAETEESVSGVILPIRWSSITGSGIEDIQDTVINTAFGYYINIPSEWRDKILFQSSASGTYLSARIYNGNLTTLGAELYSIRAVYRHEEKPEGYTKIGESQSVYYYAKINSAAITIDKSLEITYDALSGNLKLL